MSGAFENLVWHYQNHSVEALAQHKAGMPVVGFTSNTVPWELIRAAGCFPVLIGPGSDALGKPTPLADSFMEPVFDSRIRALFNEILSGAWSFLRLLIIPRTSEPEHKLYLYLREVDRQKMSNQQPPVYLYDLLHTRSPISRKYGIDRTNELIECLRQIGPINAETLSGAIRESNAARRALRRLQNLRRGSAPRISGSQAQTIAGAMYFMDRAAYAKLVDQVCREYRSAKLLRGPRFLIKGVPLHHAQLHEALEAQGAVVVAEDDWWGSRAVDANIPPARGSASMVKAVFENYYLHAPSPRVSPAAAADRWFQRAVRREIDGVVFYLPPEDDVYGWDFPRQRDFLRERGIPSLLIREDSRRGLSGDTRARVQDFIKTIRRRPHASRS